PFLREQIGPGRLRSSPKFSPKIQLPHGRQTYLARAGLDTGTADCLRNAFIGCGCACIEGWQLVCSRNAELRSRLEDPCCRDPHVIVLLYSRLDEIAQNLVLECIPPFLISE